MTFPLFEYRGVEFGGDEPIQVEAFVPGGQPSAVRPSSAACPTDSWWGATF